VPWTSGLELGIVSVCAPRQPAPALQVGKLDADYEFGKDEARKRVDHLPGPFQETPIWLNFWLKKLNANVANDRYKFTVGEALALMGSHTLIDNQVCNARENRQICAACVLTA
jgi:hypothetical protein